MTSALAKIIARKNQPAKKIAGVAEVASNVASNIDERSCSNDVDRPPAVAPPSTTAAASATGEHGQLEPCSSCGSAIRWLNAAAVPRCIGCQPPKFASLVRSKEVLVISVGQGRKSDGEAFPVPARRWEKLVEVGEGRHRGRLLSETGIRELIFRGELDAVDVSHLTAAGVGVGGRGEGVAGDGEEMIGQGMIGDEIQLARAAAQFDRWRELSDAEMDRFFESQKQQRNQKQGATP